MKKRPATTCLFVDIGDVLLSDGWDHHARRRAATRFRLDRADMEERHNLNFATYEEGRLTLDEYMGRVIFFRERSFTKTAFRNFMFAQSTPCPEMISLVSALKRQHRLKVVVVSNEARELNAYRIRTFKLAQCVDAFVSSCFVHRRKPDVGIFRLALDIAQVPARQVVYIDNTPMFVQIAEDLGMRGITHIDYTSTRARLAALGLGVAP